MKYYNIKHSREWLYENENGEIYRISVYQEEYPDGHSHPVAVGPEQLSLVEGTHLKNDAEAIDRTDVPQVILDQIED